MLFIVACMGLCSSKICASTAKKQQQFETKTSKKLKWVGSWGAGMTRALTLEDFLIAGAIFEPDYGIPLSVVYLNGLTNQTIRQIAHLTIGGEKIRLKFQNQTLDSEASGDATLTITEVRVAKQNVAQSIIPSTDKLVTFNHGQTSVQIYPGGEVVSDPIDFKIKAGDNLAVSMYFASPSHAPTALVEGTQNGYIPSSLGNFNKATTFDLDSSSAGIVAPLWLSGVDVFHKCLKGTIVCFGDSITMGFQSTLNANLSYPNQLASMLAGKGLGILNKGINGNQITNGGSVVEDGLTSVSIFGASALQRMDRDILSQSDVKFVIFLEGINDIGAERTADQIINGIFQVIKQIRIARPDVVILGGTITPYKGNDSWTQQDENTRQAVNAWIRHVAPFDAVVDFDKAIQDPSNPEFINPPYASPDFVHPNDAGYKVMAITAKKNLRKFLKT